MSIIYGVILGLGVLLLFILPTVICARITRRKSIVYLAGVTLSVWVIKLLLVIAALWLLKPYTFYDHAVFGGVIIIGALAGTVAEAVYYSKMKH